MTGASDWQGRVGASWAAEWQRTDRSFEALNARLVEHVAQRAPRNARILDIGCGAGGTSLALAERLPDAQIRGIDLSSDLIAVARQRGGASVTFEQSDASLWSSAEFVPDMMASRHGVMFFDDPVGAMRHLAGVIRPGGQLVFSCFRDRAENDWATAIAGLLPVPLPFDPIAPGPFAFADRERVTSILADAGWGDIEVEPHNFAYVAGAGDRPVDDAVDFFSQIGPAAPLIRAMEGDARADFLSRMREILGRHLHNRRVSFTASVWIWTARRPA